MPDALDFRDLATQKAQERGLDPDFVHAIIGHESSWNPNAMGTSGDMGLMQIMPKTGRSLGYDPSTLMDPATNIDAGTKLLRQLSDRFGGDRALTVAAYNAGEGRVSKLMSAHGKSAADIYPYLPKVTQYYIDKVAPLSAHEPVTKPVLGEHDTAWGRANEARGYIKPGVTNFYTKLSPENEARFRADAETGFFSPNPLSELDNPTSDYDYRGFYQGYLDKDPEALNSIDPNDRRIHWPDKWKTPYHQTFSRDSQYANKATAPYWKDNMWLIDPATGETLYDDFLQNNLSTLSAHRPLSEMPQTEPAGTIIGHLKSGRPIVRNADGSVSTHINSVMRFGDKSYIVPTMYGGKKYSDDDAANIIRRNNFIDPDTGQPLQTYDSDEEALAAEKELHKGLEQEAAPFLQRKLPELRQSQPPSIMESLYNALFSSLNTGLPEAKHWAGEGEPPAPTVTTGRLANLGLLAAGGMAGGIPELAGSIPPALLSTPGQFLKGAISSAVGSHAGGAIGERLGGDVGRDIGESIGGAVGIPTPHFPDFKKEVVAVPPIGPLRGTSIVNRQGLAKPSFHGTGAVYEHPDPMKLGDPDDLLYGPGFYHTTAGQNIAEGYSGYSQEVQLKKNLQQAIARSDAARRKILASKATLEQILPPEDLARLQDADPHQIPHLLTSIGGSAGQTGKHAIYRHAIALKNAIAERARQRTQIQEISEQLDNLPVSQPNIRPAYLNIKNPMDMDKPVSPQYLRRISGYVGLNADERWNEANIPDWVREQKKYRARQAAAELWEAAATYEKNPQYPAPNGHQIYRTVEEVLGNRADVNQILQKVGYDGITHIGGGRFAGAANAPMTHRVYIAFKPEQVIPYFHPELSEAQAAQIQKLKGKRGASQ